MYSVEAWRTFGKPGRGLAPLLVRVRALRKDCELSKLLVFPDKVPHCREKCLELDQTGRLTKIIKRKEGYSDLRDGARRPQKVGH